MSDAFDTQLPDRDPNETREWREAINQVVALDGPERAQYLLATTLQHGNRHGMGLSGLVQTPYINTIPPVQEPAYPGDLALERRIRAIMRWNAVAMVCRANKNFSGIGGHLSSYASSANLYEMGFNHFFRGPGPDGHDADQIFYQGHATPGIYARAFLEGRLGREHLEHFRRETAGKGLSSYPHPWLQPKLWQFPTVSMGLGPIHAIYQARFNRYLLNRNLKDTAAQHVWAYLGDGECDEPESLGALSLAAREGLGNLTFVINCNLQRLDGPVRGNGKIIQELERIFLGSGWNVIKVVWGPEWDDLLAKDFDGKLTRRLGEIVDGQYQKWTVADGATIRQELFGSDPELLRRVEHLSDAEITQLRRGGHADVKVHAAYEAAKKSDLPTCILVKTVKGWTLGDGFEASNVTHQMKKLDEKQLLRLRDRLELPIPDEDVKEANYYHPGEQSAELAYIRERREALGGPLPSRHPKAPGKLAPEPKVFEEFFAGSKGNMEVSTTMAFVRLLRALMRDKNLGKHVVPIIPDEARTFGMDPFFREFGIYAAHGQKYVPIDSSMLLNYHEAQDGQLLEEGITEAGAMSSFMAAATAHATHGLCTVPFYIFYSMFGMQRTGDQVWAVGDARGRGFMLGATAGRTTLHGEGLQHNDGHSHLFAQAVPNLMAYDPAFACETAVIVQDGLDRMITRNEDVFYYLTLYNENYVMPALPTGQQPKGAAAPKEGIVRGMWRVGEGKGKKGRVQLLASGPMVRLAFLAQTILKDEFDVACDVWSVTSYQQLYRDGRSVARHNMLHPTETKKKGYFAQALEHTEGPIVAVSDYVSELPSLVTRFAPRPMTILGTNGFGRSDTREALRRHFEVDESTMAYACLSALAEAGVVTSAVVKKALKKLNIDPDAQDPMLL